MSNQVYQRRLWSGGGQPVRLETPESVEERERCVRLVMDLVAALRHIKGKPRLMDLVKLAKRIRHG